MSLGLSTGDRSNVNEFREIVLVGHVISMPCNHVKGAVILRALEKFAPKLVHNLPRLLLNLVLGHWVEEVTGVREAIGPQWSCRSQYLRVT